VKDLAEYGCLTRMHVVRLLALGWTMKTTPRTSISRRAFAALEAGRVDTIRALRRAPWNDACDPLEGVILHEPMPAPCRQLNCRAAGNYGAFGASKI